jgi:hypothetical protein
VAARHVLAHGGVPAVGWCAHILTDMLSEVMAAFLGSVRAVPAFRAVRKPGESSSTPSFASARPQ